MKWHSNSNVQWGKLISLCINIYPSIPPQFHWQRSANRSANKSSKGERGHNDGPDQGENIFWYVTLVTLAPRLVYEILHMLEIKKGKHDIKKTLRRQVSNI